MSLIEDINAGLAALSEPNRPDKLVLDGSGRCNIKVFLPASVVKLKDSNLMIQVQISRTGRFFSLLSPIGVLKGNPSREFFAALFYRQFYADQVSGASLAINAEDHVVVAVYHWILESITPNDFSSLFQGFVAATLDLLREVRDLAEVAPNSIEVNLI